MNSVLQLLNVIKKEIMVDLKGNPAHDLILQKNEIENSINLLSLMKAHGITFINIDSVHELPFMATGYSSYRIMNDCEIENRDLWIEVDENLSPGAGDIIITRKMKRN